MFLPIQCSCRDVVTMLNRDMASTVSCAPIVFKIKPPEIVSFRTAYKYWKEKRAHILPLRLTHFTRSRTTQQIKYTKLITTKEWKHRKKKKKKKKRTLFGKMRIDRKITTFFIFVQIKSVKYAEWRKKALIFLLYI